MPAKARSHNKRRTSEKLYTRIFKSPSVTPSSPTMSDTQESVISPLLAPSPEFANKPGFPTYAQYKRIELAYLTCLSPRKRDKALITQAMFDKVWDVLHQPDACNIETPQFRFWVRKMFTLSRPQRRQADYEDDNNDIPPVVLHENRPVAVMEQLYEVFCYCHERAGHGGRDKTCAVIRQHYSWVPKELTAQFVKACPTCTLKRSGNPDLVAMVQEQVSKREIQGHQDDGFSDQFLSPTLSIDDSTWCPTPEIGWPPSSGPMDTQCAIKGYSEEFHCPSHPSLARLSSYAASRDMSLLNDVPHGWTHLPPLSIEGNSNDAGHASRSEEPTVLPNLKHALGYNKSDTFSFLPQPHFGSSGHSLPFSLQHLQLSNPIIPTGYESQIDPLLLLDQYLLEEPTSIQGDCTTHSDHCVISSAEDQLSSLANFAISRSSSIEISPCRSWSGYTMKLV